MRLRSVCTRFNPHRDRPHFSLPPAPRIRYERFGRSSRSDANALLGGRHHPPQKRHMEFNNLKFSRAIVHEALKRTPQNQDQEPEESDSLLEMDSAAEKEVSARIAGALGRNSHCVDDTTQGSVFEISARLLDANEVDFVKLTQTLARKLSNSQVNAGAAKTGLAVFIQGTIEQEKVQRRILLLIKADAETAFLKERKGKQVILKLITDIFFGPQQKLYKIGALVEKASASDPRDPAEFSAHVFDHLMSDAGDRKAAAYFYQIFLGCKLAESAKRRTREFLELTSDFIDTIPKITKLKKVELKNHLKVYLKNEKQQFSVAEFADEFLRQELHSDYKKHMRKSKFPTSAVTKNTDLIKNKLRLQNVFFTSQVRISAPADQFEKLVEIGRQENGWTEVKIKGDVEGEIEVKSKGE